MYHLSKSYNEKGEKTSVFVKNFYKRLQHKVHFNKKRTVSLKEIVKIL